MSGEPSKASRALAGASTEALLSTFNIAVGLAVVPIYFQFVSVESYGIWLVLGGIFGLLSVADFGILVWLTREVTAHQVRSDQSRLNDTYSTVLILQALIGAVIFGIGLVLMNSLPSWLKLDPDLLSEFKTTYIVGLLAFCLKFPLSVFGALLNGKHYTALVSYTNGLALMGISIFSIVPLSLGAGISSFALALLLGNFISALALYLKVRRVIPELRFVLRGSLIGPLRRLSAFAFSFQTIKLGYMVQQFSSSPIVALLFGPASVTTYSITNRVAQSIPGNIARSVTAAFPAIAEMNARADLKRIRAAFLGISCFAVRIALLALVGIVSCNRMFITLWVGADKFAGTDVSIVLALIMTKDIYFNCLGLFVFASDRFGFWPVLAVIEVFLVVILSLLLGSNIGLVGVAIGFLVPSLLTNIYLLWRLCNWLGVTAKDLLSLLGGILIKSLPMFLIAATFFAYQIPSSWTALFTLTLLLVGANLLFFDLVHFLSSPDPSYKGRLRYTLRAALGMSS